MPTPSIFSLRSFLEKDELSDDDDDDDDNAAENGPFKVANCLYRLGRAAGWAVPSL